MAENKGSSSSGSSSSEKVVAREARIEFESTRLPTVLTGKKVHFSNFSVLLNTNKLPPDEDTAKEMAKVLGDMADQMFASAEQVGRFVTFSDPEAHWSPENIRRVKTAYAVEMGEHLGRLHLHVSIKIVHNTMVRLNLDLLQSTANELLTGSGLSIAYTHISVHGPTPEDYLGKYQ